MIAAFQPMDINAILLTFGLPAFFASRAFTTTFVTALVLRFGDTLPYLKEIEFLQATGAEPIWFTSLPILLGLGTLATLELVGTKFNEAEELLGEVHKYAKTGMSFVTTMGILSAKEAGFIEGVLDQAGMLDIAWALTVAVGTQLLTTLRNSTIGILIDADPDDDVGLRGLISWFEDLWGGFGLLLIFLFPLLILGIAAALIGIIWLIRKQAERREEKSKVPCTSCQTPMYQSAPHCPSCGANNPQPVTISFFGTAQIGKPAGPLAEHSVRLARKRRCPRCATRLEVKDTNQNCTACGQAPFGTQDFRDRYTSAVTARLPKVLLISGLFSLVPIFGAIPGIIYYRFALVAPLRAYIPTGQGFFLRWFLRILFLFIITAQVIPGIGAFMIPLMAFISYTVYRGALSSRLSETPLS